MIKREYGEHTTLENRSMANDSIDRNKRYRQIIEILKENPEGLSAKEIAIKMYEKEYTPTTERNFSSPRLNELCIDGKVDVIGKKKCEYSHKMVSVFQLRKEN